VAPINCFVKSNFDSDKKNLFSQQEIILVYLLITVDLTVFWSFDKSEKKIVLGSQIGIDLSGKAVRHLDIINFNGKKYLLVSINNAKVEVYEMPMSNL
jgi:hypothetical protein